MTQMSVLELDDHRFSVEILEGDETTVHEVVVSDGFLHDLALDGSDVERRQLVLEAMAFLLEREPAVEIPDRLSLDDISNDYRDEFTTELRARIEA